MYKHTVIIYSVEAVPEKQTYVYATYEHVMWSQGIKVLGQISI